MAQKKKFAKIALFEYALLQQESIQFLKDQLHAATPAHNRHFLVNLIYTTAESRRKNVGKLCDKYRQYVTSGNRCPSETYTTALARLFVMCEGVRLPESIWTEVSDLAQAVADFHRQTITARTRNWNEEGVMQSPAAEFLEPLVDPLMLNNERRFSMHIVTPLSECLPPYNIVRERLGSERAEQYRMMIENFEVNGTYDFFDALERGKTQKWNTIYCEQRVRLLNILHDAQIEANEFGLPVAEVACTKFKK